MSTKSPGEITRLLSGVRQGDRAAETALAELVYDELRRIARRHLGSERKGHSLQPTALTNEVYLKLLTVKTHDWHDRVHFFAVASQQMRRMLVDHARSVHSQRRGGGASRLTLDFEPEAPAAMPIDDVLSVDQALERLEQVDPRQARVVELRFFAGLSEEEIAELLGVSERTIKRDWRMAKIWLRREMDGAR